MPTPNAPAPLPVGPAAAPNVLPMPSVLNGAPDIAQATASKVSTVANAIGNTTTGLWPVLGGVAMLGLTFLGLKTIVLGKNPLKS